MPTVITISLKLWLYEEIKSVDRWTESSRKIYYVVLGFTYIKHNSNSKNILEEELQPCSKLNTITQSIMIFRQAK